MFSRRALAFLVALVCLLGACGDLRHPLDDSETRPETEALAFEEAGDTLDDIGESVLDGTDFAEDTWSAEDGCDTAPFAPSQGDVGLVLIRTYTADDLEGASVPELLIDDFESFWSAQEKSVSRSSPNMDPGAVIRINGIGYELVSLPRAIELRAFIPCY